jgi:hypothetical protein
VVVLSAASVPQTLALGNVLARGLPLSFTAQAGTTVVRVQIFRAGSKRALATVFVKAKRGKVTFRLKTRSVARALRLKGKFRIELTPGASRTKLGKTTIRTIVIR